MNEHYKRKLMIKYIYTVDYGNHFLEALEFVANYYYNTILYYVLTPPPT